MDTLAAVGWAGSARGETRYGGNLGSKRGWPCVVAR